MNKTILQILYPNRICILVKRWIRNTYYEYIQIQCAFKRIFISKGDTSQLKINKIFRKTIYAMSITKTFEIFFGVKTFLFKQIYKRKYKH